MALMNPLQKELDCALRLAEAAGKLILEKRGVALANVTQKSNDQGPVTEADLAADALISEGLSKAFPDDVLITEETWATDDDLPQASRVWCVDPLDGTSDFSRGGPDYVVMIGLCLEGRPALGVVYHPVSETFWTGVRDTDGGGKRAEKINRGQRTALQVRPFKTEHAAVLVSRSHPSKRIDEMLNTLALKERITRGSVGLKGGAIAHGEADLYVTATNRIKVWDTCAPQAILEAAGGKLTGLLGAPLKYTEKASHPVGLCAASDEAYTHFQPLIKDLWEKRQKLGLV